LRPLWRGISAGLFHSIAPGSEFLNKTVAEIGLPTWDVMWARSANRAVGFELAGDNPFSTRPSGRKKPAMFFR